MKYLLLASAAVVMMGGAVDARADNALTGLDAQQRKMITIEAPKQGGAVLMREEIVTPVTTDDVQVITVPDAGTSVTVEEGASQLLPDRVEDVRSQMTFDEIQGRLQSSDDLNAIPGVQGTESMQSPVPTGDIMIVPEAQ